MSKFIYLFLSVAVIIGISIYFFTANTQLPAPLHAPRSAQHVSQAFKIMQTVRSESGKNSATSLKNVAANDVNNTKLVEIVKLRASGASFLNQQEEYLNSLSDVHTRNEANITLTLGNQLMLAAVLAEMSKSAEYSEQLTNLLQDQGLRSFILNTMSGYFPELSKHIEQGEIIDANNLSSMFSDERDFLAEFDDRVASRLSEDYAAAFESGIANYVAADVLAWQAIFSGQLDKSSVPQFLWGAPYGG